MDIKMLLLYFLIGGVMVASISFFGGQSKSILAAFIAFLPSISVITLCAIYLASGPKPAVSYAKGMLFMLPSWILYILAVIFLLPRIGLLPSLVVSVGLYIGTAFLVMKLTS